MDNLGDRALLIITCINFALAVLTYRTSWDTRYWMYRIPYRVKDVLNGRYYSSRSDG